MSASLSSSPCRIQRPGRTPPPSEKSVDGESCEQDESAGEIAQLEVPLKDRVHGNARESLPCEHEERGVHGQNPREDEVAGR